MWGVERVKDDLMRGGKHILDVARPARQRAWVEEWIRMKEDRTQPANSAGPVGGVPFVAESRIEELRKLSSANYDFRKLIRLCEELNTCYQNSCFLAIAMLTRSLLDHVPPVFGKPSFGEVANNYGTRSFKEAMQHLEDGARKVADGHLHGPIRQRETLPTLQQVHFGPMLDMLLAEIVRITE